MKRTTIPELDGIRGLAVLGVCLFHFIGLPLGWTGVDLFFVLSGCLITGILLDTKYAPNFFRVFYMRRVLRILPLYYLFVAGFFWIVLPIAQHHGVFTRESTGEQIWYWLHLSNWRSGFGSMIETPMAHLWSLAIEEQFYLIWPAVVLWTSPRRLRALCITLIVGALALRLAAVNLHWAHGNPEVIYRLTPFRVDALAFGALIPLLLRSGDARRLRATSLVAAICGAFVVATAVLATPGVGSSAFDRHALLASTYHHAAGMHTFGYTGVALVCFSMVLYANLSVVPFLRSTPLRTLGMYSYALYLIHDPVAFVLQRTLIPRLTWHPHLIATMVGLPLSLALAMLSWRCVERPLLRLKRHFEYETAVQRSEASSSPACVATSRAAAS